MRKKIFITIGLVFILLIGAGIWIAFNADKLIAKLKPQIESLASDILGVNIKIGNIDGTLFPTSQLKLSNLLLGDSGTTDGSLELKEIILDVELLPALSGKLEVSKLSVVSPKITILKTSDQIKIIGLPKRKPSSSTPSDKSSTEQSDLTAGFSVNLDKLQVEDGTLILKGISEDREFVVSGIKVSTGLTIVDNKVKIPNYTLEALLLNKLPIAVSGENLDFSLDSEILNAPKNIINIYNDQINLSAKYELKKESGLIDILSEKGLQLAKYLESDSILLDFIPAEFHQYKVAGICIPNLKVEIASSKPKFTGTIKLVDLATTISKFNVEKLEGTISLDGDLDKQKAEANKLMLQINKEPLSVLFAITHESQKIIAQQLQIDGFGGSVSLPLTVTLAQPSVFSVAPQGTTLQAERVIAVAIPGKSPPVKGLITKFAGNLTGSLEKDLLNSINGNIKFQLEKGSLQGLNFASKVLRSIKDIPLISGTLYQKVPEDKRVLVDSPDTEIQLATGSFQISNTLIRTNDLKAHNSLFSIDADGTIAFSTAVKMNSTISFQPDFSKALVASIRELRNILDSNERLTFPLSIEGIPPDLIVIPNLSKLLEMGTKKIIKDKASQILEKTLKDKSGITIKGLEDAFGF